MPDLDGPLSAARELVANALGVPPRSVPDDARIGSLEPWDSLGHLRIMLAIEDVLGRQMDAAEAIEIETLRDIDRLLRP